LTPVNKTRIRESVYVVGAGFSHGLQYPMTNDLLTGVWGKLTVNEREQLRKIIAFHHPKFDPKHANSFPEMERFLTEVDVNLKLFYSSRPSEGGFTKSDLQAAHDNLLWRVSSWFHGLFEEAIATPWVNEFADRLKRENAGIISFNWDLILDQLVFDGEVTARNYGVSSRLGKGPLLFKPHGSLNWYNGNDIDVVAESKRVEIFHSKNETKCVHAFTHPRLIKSKVGNRYAPLIIPPTFLKDFKPSIFRRLWKNTTDVLSTPKTLYFLGYSLPASDLHAQFIFRCGFYNQIHGRLSEDGTRHPATGAAEVVVVNPNKAAFRRIRDVAGPEIRCRWVNKTIEQWLASTGHHRPRAKK
jgi:hypothetical protein